MPKRQRTDSPKDEPIKKQAKNMNHWSLGLLKTMKDPKYIVETDTLITIIKDVYPKAKFHYLVLPNERINSIRKINKNHLSLLRHMDNVARELVKKIDHNGRTFKIGYHSEPSMSQLHLHVISDDFCSSHLKNKKHFNSFNTKFFINSEDVIEELEKNGNLKFKSPQIYKEYLNLPLKCQKCGENLKNIPQLHLHMNKHEKV